MEKAEDGSGFLIEPLTQRERNILAHLANDRSSQEIARLETLAYSSVKWYIHQVYAKLGVNRRRDAITRATDLGLLRPEPKLFASAWMVKNNLPRQLTSFIGREEEITQPLAFVQELPRFFGREAEISRVKELLRANRLVTLTGSGGVGKTRLALRVAWELLEEYRDGAWFVELASLSNPEGVGGQVVRALHLPEPPGRPILEVLALLLRDEHRLLILDNCEHLLEACAQLVDVLLRACPRLRFLVTSREPFRMDGETTFRVPSLPFPDPQRLPEIEKLGEYTALSLFMDRASAALPGYTLTSHNAPHLARICKRLDGIPLAIELAAARINILSAEQLASRLEENFQLLTRGSRVALPRQQTLRATIDWSYDLLSEAERLLLQGLSVFAGGCTLEAAEAVCGGEDLDTGQVLESLTGLVDKSMVIVERQPGEEARYRMLEMVRQYGREKLAERGESERMHRRHRDYFLQFAESSSPRFSTKERPAWIKRFETDHENLSQALEWSFSDEMDIEAGPRLVVALDPFWDNRDWREQGKWWHKGVELCRGGAAISPMLQARLKGRTWWLVLEEDQQLVWDLASESLAISRSLGPEDKETLLYSMGAMAIRYIDFGPDNWVKAQDLLDEQAALVQSLGPDSKIDPRFYQADIGIMQAELDIRRSQDEQAKTRILGSIRLFKEFGPDVRLIRPYQMLAGISLRAGEYSQARTYLVEGLHLAIENDAGEGGILAPLCETELRQGNLEIAFEYCKDYIELAYKYQTPFNTLERIEMAARLFARRGKFLEAARMSGAAEALSEQHGRKSSPEPYLASFPGDWRTRFADASLDALVPGWRLRPDGEAIQQAWNEGREMTYDQVVVYVLSCEI